MRSLIKQKNSAIEKWNRIKSAVTEPLNSAKNTVVSVASGIWSSLTSKFEQIRSSTVSKFNSVKNAIVDPIREAKDKVSGFIESIKGFFSNLKLKIPKPSMPSMPSFSLKTSSKTVLGKEITYPSGINVKWNAKGGIMNKPTIFGSMGNNLLGGGEVSGESEAILPLNDKNLGGIGMGILQALNKENTDKHLNSTVTISPIYITVQSMLNGKMIANELLDPIDTGLNNKSGSLNFGTTGRFS